jgi:hypothetical protein
MSPASIITSTCRWYSAQLAKFSGMPVRGSASNTVRR